MTGTRIGLVGAGAVGSLVAAALSANRYDFQWVVRNPERRRDLSRQNIQIGGIVANLACRPQVVESLEQLHPGLALIIVAVKAPDVLDVVEQLRNHPAEVLVIANGLLAGGYHLGLLYGGAKMSGGDLLLAEHNRLYIGRLDRSGPLPRLAEAALATAWLQLQACDDIAVRMWHKLALNCVINPLTALLDCVNGDLPGSGDAPLIKGMLVEVNLVAAAVLSDRWCYSVEQLCADYSTLVQNTATNSSSMREDLREGKPTEIGMLNLAVADRGASLELDCPLNRLIGHMIFLQTNR